MSNPWDYTLPATISNLVISEDGTVSESVSATQQTQSDTTTQETSTTNSITRSDIYNIIYELLGNYPNPIRIGSGDQVYRVDTGIGQWLGNANFGEAPFSVSMDGLMTTKNGIVLGNLQVGATSGGYILIDGTNKLIKSSNYSAQAFPTI